MALSIQLAILLIFMFLLFLALPRLYSWRLLFAILLLVPSSAQGLISGTAYDTMGVWNISMVGYGVLIMTIVHFFRSEKLPKGITICVIASFAVILMVRIIADGIEFISNKLLDNYFLPMLLALLLISSFKVEWLPKVFDTMYWFILFGAVVACIEYFLGKSLFFHEYYMKTCQWYVSIYNSTQYDVAYRSCSIFGHPLTGSIYYLIGIVYLFNQKRLRKRGFLFIAQTSILLLAVLSTNSRSAILGFVLYLTLYLFTNKRIGKLALFMILIIILVPSINWEHLYLTFFARDQSGTSFMIRINAILSITKLPLRTVLFGEGYNNTKSLLKTLGFTGNVEISYLIILIENGIIGFTAWLFSIVSIYKYKMPKSSINGFKASSALNGMLLVVLFVGGFSNSFGDPGTLNYIIYSLLAFTYILARSGKKQTSFGDASSSGIEDYTGSNVLCMDSVGSVYR